MSNDAYPQRLLLLATALFCLVGLSGCPEVAAVTVEIKPATGAAAAGGESSGGAPAAVAGYGNLVGTVTYEGTPPDLKPIITAGDQTVKDPAVCAAQPVPDESLVVNPQNKGIANAVIFLEKRPASIKPELAEPPTDPVYFDQKGCRFMPHVLAVRVGQPLLIVSEDSIPHNTMNDPKRNSQFNQTILPNDRKGVPLKYTKPESAPIEAKCSYHAWMKAYHFPIDHPYVAVTDKDGNFKIEGLPAGKHSFNVWHERGPAGSGLIERKLQITIEPDKDTEKKLSYGANKIAGAPSPVRRSITFERLQQGGEITVSQAEVLR